MKHFNEFINESKKDISQYSEIIQIIYNELSDLTGKSLKIDISIDDNSFGKSVKLEGKFKDNSISRSMGHILEGYILSYLQSWEHPEGYNEYFQVIPTDNDTYDADIEFHSAFKNNVLSTGVEIKAFKDKTYNINFTEKQRSKISNKDILYIFIKYSNTNNSIKIEKIYVGTYEDVSNGKSTISKHGSIKNMVSTDK